MKFVHLTQRGVIDRIIHTGLRPGGGRWGRGVYCVPLMAMSQLRWERDADEPIVVEQVSTSQMWKWLMRSRRPTGQIMAVVFEAPSSAWPLDVYLDILWPTGRGFLEAIDGIKSDEVTFAARERERALEAMRRRYSILCAFQAHSARGLGRLLHHYQTAVAREGIFNDSLEVVMRKTIAPASIVRLVPHYQTNRDFRHKRERASRPAGD